MDDEHPKGAERMTKHLDLLTDEPLELAVALRKLAETKLKDSDGDDEEWAAFSAVLEKLVEDLKALNEPKESPDAR